MRVLALLANLTVLIAAAGFGSYGQSIGSPVIMVASVFAMVAAFTGVALVLVSDRR